MLCRVIPAAPRALSGRVRGQAQPLAGGAAAGYRPALDKVADDGLP